MSDYVLIRHKVRSFAEWKKHYDAHRPKRTEASLTDRQVFQSAADPNEVHVLMEIGDMARAKEFADSADLKETMMKAGVTDKPDVRFLKG